MWFFLFSPTTKGLVHFWFGMTIAAGSLAAIGLWLNRNINRILFRLEPHHIIAGILSAILLYVIFYSGELLASRLFDFAKPQVAAVYDTRSQASAWTIGILLFFWIGPAEEIFWRGYIQRRLSDRLGAGRGFFTAALIYALVHIWALNAMLFLAAGLSGLFWGAMFWRYKSIWPGLISHSLWDVAVFVLWPIN